MSAPAWLAATSGNSGLAGQVNQFLTTHAVEYLYTGVLQSSQQTASGTGDHSNGLWIAQSFTTAAAQTTVGYVLLYLDVTGSPAPWTISLQANSSGAPSGTALVSASLPKEFAAASYGWVMVPLPATGLTASAQYWIVANAVGDPSDFFSWHLSNQSSGSSTSTNGTSWTAQGDGLMYQVYDQSPVAPLAATWEDSGARWTSLAYTSGELTGLEEYTAGQAANGYTASSRALTYTGNLLTGVA